jgi:hypothetical protein
MLYFTELQKRISYSLQYTITVGANETERSAIKTVQSPVKSKKSSKKPIYLYY